MSALKKDLGQYFTIHPSLQQFVFDKTKYKNQPLLEPSFGAGHLLVKFKEYNDRYPMVCYEIDRTIKPVVSFSEDQKVYYTDFTQNVPSYKFDTIIGNPPYVKIKKRAGAGAGAGTNLYLQFIELCFERLSDHGEMIFIVPSDFIKLTRSASILDKMNEAGSFTDFFFPNDERLFQGANIDVLVFRYEKGVFNNNKTNVNGIEKIYLIHHGVMTFHDTISNGTLIEDLFHIYVGLVTGKDEVFRVPFGNMNVLVDRDKVEPYIYIESFPCENERILQHLQNNKTALLERKIRKFHENNWYEWGAPRNLQHMKAHKNKPCIYIRTLTRQKTVAFLSTMQYFGGGLLCLLPKTSGSDGISLTQLEAICDYFNSDEFQKNYTYSGRFKIGHKQLSKAWIPSTRFSMSSSPSPYPLPQNLSSLQLLDEPTSESS